MDWKSLFFSFKGRISRMWWWIGIVAVFVVSMGLSIALLWLLGGDPSFYWNDQPATPLTALVDAVAFVLTVRLSLAVDIKRIHDRGRTAYLLVPLYLGELAIIATDGLGYDIANLDVDKLQAEAPIQLMMTLGLILPFLAFTLWMIFELGFRTGTSGTSKYGPDPLAALTQRTRGIA